MSRALAFLISADRDVMTPPVFADQIAAALSQADVTRLHLADCGHLALHDQTDRVIDALRAHVLKSAPQGETT